MDRQSLAFRTDQEDGQALLAVTGEIDMATAEALFRQATALIDDGARQLVLDLGGVTFCDSLGLAALVRVYRHGTAAGCVLRLTNPHDHVAHVLHISGLDQILEVVPAPSPERA
jgi:anti-sigma B factor antagonist